MLRFAALTIFLLLSACGDSASTPGPGGIGVEDAKALDQAAEELDAESANPDT